MSERACNICGCTELKACLHEDGTPCCWVDDELCSRCHELMHTPALEAIAAERARQVQQEGFTAEHDDSYDGGDLALAAASYAYVAGTGDGNRRYLVDHPEARALKWPWDSKWFKPSTRRRDLVKAGALILAAIERLDRRAAKAGEK